MGKLLFCQLSNANTAVIVISRHSASCPYDLIYRINCINARPRLSKVIMTDLIEVFLTLGYMKHLRASNGRFGDDETAFRNSSKKKAHMNTYRTPESEETITFPQKYLHTLIFYLT